MRYLANNRYTVVPCVLPATSYSVIPHTINPLGELPNNAPTLVGEGTADANLLDTQPQYVSNSFLSYCPNSYHNLIHKKATR